MCVSVHLELCMHMHLGVLVRVMWMRLLLTQVLLHEIEDYRLTLDGVNRLGQQLLMNNARIPRLVQQVQAQLQNLEESYMNLQSTAQQIRVSTPHSTSCTQHWAVSLSTSWWLVGWSVCLLVGLCVLFDSSFITVFVCLFVLEFCSFVCFFHPLPCVMDGEMLAVWVPVACRWISKLICCLTFSFWNWNSMEKI